MCVVAFIALTRRRFVLMVCWLASVFVAMPPVFGDERVMVEAEEVVTRYAPADNGAGPLWCYGASVIARLGDDVFLSVIETGKDVPPLCNTRWQIWRRSGDGWALCQQEAGYRQREPCPIAVFHDGPVFLSANPSTQPPGTEYGPCRPVVFEIDPRQMDAKPTVHEPAFAEGHQFTDHSYRGFAADGARRELLLLNVHSQSGEYFVTFRDRAGNWHPKRNIRFPIRSCYPQVQLRNGAAHVMAIVDIVEPVKEWRELKFAKLGRQWDYVFRRLFYTYTPDIRSGELREPIEVDTVEKTAGHISNLDLFVDASGAAHLLYLKQPHQYAFIRDAYFPGQAMTVHLEYVTVRAGRVVERVTLAETPRKGSGLTPSFARFHIASDKEVHVLAAGTRPAGKDGPATFGNSIARLLPADKRTAFERIEMKHPFRTWFVGAPRVGCRPGKLIDVFGIADDSPNLRYARLRIR